MGTLPQSSPEPEQNREWHDPVIHGSKAAIAAAIFACIAALAAGGTCYINWSNRSDQKTQQAKEQVDNHINALIDLKLNPSAKMINDHTDEKVGELSGQIHALDVRIARLEGPLTKRVGALETKTKQQTSLAKVMDPNRILIMIRAQLEVSKAHDHLLPTSDIQDYKNAVQALPVSAREYWTTVAAIINYQSLINQMSGEVPDPQKVSRPCQGMTKQPGILSENNSFVNLPISNCVVDLDTLHFIGNTFINSVIRYHGGPTTLTGVTFVNCYFDVELPESTKPPEQPARAILFSLLNSADQRHVKVSTPPS